MVDDLYKFEVPNIGFSVKSIILPLNVAGPVRFTESETNNLICGLPFEDGSDSFQKKSKYLGFHQWTDGIAKNIKVLIEISNQH